MRPLDAANARGSVPETNAPYRQQTLDRVRPFPGLANFMSAPSAS